MLTYQKGQGRCAVKTFYIHVLVGYTLQDTDYPVLYYTYIVVAFPQLFFTACFILAEMFSLRGRVKHATNVKSA